MTYHDISWHIMTYHDISWHIMTYHDISWHIMTYHDISWHIMTYHDISWHIMTYHDISWHIMTYHDISWHIMTYHDISWHIMTYHDISWHIMTYHDISWHVGNMKSCQLKRVIFAGEWYGCTGQKVPPSEFQASHCWHKDSWTSPSCWETKLGEIFTTSARFLMTAVGGCPSISFIRPIHSKLTVRSFELIILAVFRCYKLCKIVRDVTTEPTL